MKYCFELLTAAGLALMVAQSASAGLVHQSNFDNQGDHDDWIIANGVREVAGDDGVMRVRTTSNDPQVTRTAANQFTRLGTEWTYFEVLARELDQVGGTPIPFDPTGTVLILNTQTGTPNVNLGAPTVGPADAEGYRLLTWDISDFTPASTGGIRFDFFGGPGTTGTATAPNNIGEVDFIRISDNFTAVPEPSSLMLVGLGGLPFMWRRRR